MARPVLKEAGGAKLLIFWRATRNPS